VSRETAEEMARGLRHESGADFSVAITGIAGPGGGSKDKPVGLVYLAILHDANVKIIKMNLRGNRQRIRNMAALHALDEVRKWMLSNKD
jgi:nicotinamide-nucleotide amidase